MELSSNICIENCDKLCFKVEIMYSRYLNCLYCNKNPLTEVISYIWKSESVNMLLFQLCLTLCDPMDLSHQAPLSMEFSRQEFQSGKKKESLGKKIPFSGEPLQPRFQTPVFLHCRQILYHLSHQGSLIIHINILQYFYIR